MRGVSEMAELSDVQPPSWKEFSAWLDFDKVSLRRLPVLFFLFVACIVLIVCFGSLTKLTERCSS